MSVAELAHGVRRAETPERVSRRQRFLDELLRDIRVYPANAETALIAGRIGGEQALRGISIPFEDLLIAATALQNGFGVLTSNVRHFRLIPGLEVIAA